MNLQKFILELLEQYENWVSSNWERRSLLVTYIYMAYKTALTAQTLKDKMEQAGFQRVEVCREWLNLTATGYC